jgi:hypothetical protein
MELLGEIYIVEHGCKFGTKLIETIFTLLLFLLVLETKESFVFHCPDFCIVPQAACYSLAFGNA